MPMTKALHSKLRKMQIMTARGYRFKYQMAKFNIEAKVTQEI
jgi:hypothetical protein